MATDDYKLLARLPFKHAMTADQALFIIKKTNRATGMAPLEIGKDKNGMVVQWYLVDCTLTLRRKDGNGPYAVSNISPKTAKAEWEILRNKAKQGG